MLLDNLYFLIPRLTFRSLAGSCICPKAYSLFEIILMRFPNPQQSYSAHPKSYSSYPKWYSLREVIKIAERGIKNIKDDFNDFIEKHTHLHYDCIVISITILRRRYFIQNDHMSMVWDAKKSRYFFFWWMSMF